MANTLSFIVLLQLSLSSFHLIAHFHTCLQIHAEADSFFCFVELLSEFRDNFCQQLDNSVVGIRSTISRLSQLLKRHDEELWRHLEVTTQVYPFLNLIHHNIALQYLKTSIFIKLKWHSTLALVCYPLYFSVL